MTKAVERLTTGVQQLADLLSLKMPDLPTSATLSKGGLQIVESISSFTVREEGQGVGIWDDEEEKRFYEDLIDLKEVVPNGLLGIKEKKDVVTGEAGAGKGEAEGEGALERQKQEEEDIQRQLDQMMLDPAPESTAPPPVEEPEAVSMSRSGSKTSAKAPGSPIIPTNALLDDEDGPPADSGIVGEDEGLQPGPAARLTALFAALPEAVNREIIDKLAVEFTFLNSKAARKRLIKVSCHGRMM
jgi:regulator of nonsense transcripts 2